MNSQNMLVTALMDLYDLPLIYRILFILSTFLLVLYLAVRYWKRTLNPPISSPINSPTIKKSTPFCEQMTVEEYEKVGREYTKAQVRKLKSSPGFKAHVQKKRLSRCKSAENLDD